jgi:ABC-type nickel/cobalt efflux system permease component RcnA
LPSCRESLSSGAHSRDPVGIAPITVATIAVIAVSAKDVARWLSGAGEGGGTLVMRGIEFGAAGLVLLFGAGLLFGHIAAERVTCS